MSYRHSLFCATHLVQQNLQLLHLPHILNDAHCPTSPLLPPSWLSAAPRRIPGTESASPPMSSSNNLPPADDDASKPAFALTHAPLPSSSRSSPSVTPLSPRRVQSHPRACANSGLPNSPNGLVRAWTQTRSISSTLDLSRHFVSILLLSNRCRRAAFAEKQLLKVAERYSVSRRLLILSAGLYSEPGEMLPSRLIEAARHRDIDLSDERPCAAFSLSDLDYYDYIVVVDRNVRDKLLVLAEAHAHKSGGHLYEWERKIRLLCDFESALPRNQGSTGVPLDVPSFNTASHLDTCMDIIQNGCDMIIRSLITAGL